jgi:ADP-heptose:LPS heptosyltransferase
MNQLLICHRGALGDFILTWPALYALREILPDLHFLGLGRPEYMRLAVKLGLLDSSRDAESSRMIDFFSGRSIPTAFGVPKGAVLWLSQGEAVADLLKKTASLPVVLIPPFPSKRMHVGLYHYLAVQSYFPIKASYPGFPHFPLCVKRGEYALIHPGSGSPSKNYHVQFYLDLAGILRQSNYPDVRFILGPVEGEQIVQRLVGERIDRPKDVVALAQVLAGASLYIGNDSGVSHLSGILGTQTITLYKTTDPKVWGVVGRGVINLQSQDENAVLAKIKKDGLTKWTFYETIKKCLT